MLYPTIKALLDAVINYSEDTPASGFGDSTERYARLCHYFDMAVQEIWGARPWWPFRKGSTDLTLSAGQATLPANFGGVGNDGYVVIKGSRNLPWVSCSFQELVAVRNNTVWPAAYQQDRLYAIGSSSTAGRVDLYSGKTDDAREITLYYDIVTPATDPNTISVALPLPAYLHKAALMGTIWHSALSKNDERAPEFYRQFMQALSDGIKEGRPKPERPRQLPQTVGRMY